MKPDFFYELESKLDKREESQRFLEELRDHWEDHQEMEKPSVEPSQILGRAPSLQNDFNHFLMTKNFSRDFWQYMVVIVFSLPLFTLGWALMYVVIEYVAIDDFNRWIPALFIVGLDLMILLLWYIFRMPQIFLEIQSRRRLIAATMLLFIPTLVLGLGLLGSFAVPINSRGPEITHIFLIIGSFILFAIATFFFALHMRRKYPPQPHIEHRRFSKIAAVIMIYLVVTQILQWVNSSAPSADFSSGAKALFMPRIFFEGIFVGLPMNFFLSGGLSPYTAYLILGSVLTLIAACALFVCVRVFFDRRNRPFPWSALIVATELIFLLFAAPLRFPQVSSPLPMRHISWDITNQELKFYARWVRSMGETLGGFFHYNIFVKDQTFLVNQDFGSLITLDQIVSVDDLRIREKAHREPIWGKEWAHPERDVFFVEPSGEQLFTCNPLINTVPTPCETLFYKGQKIFEVEYPGQYPIDGLALSSDRRFLLVKINHSPSGLEDIYLLDLSLLSI